MKSRQLVKDSKEALLKEQYETTTLQSNHTILEERLKRLVVHSARKSNDFCALSESINSRILGLQQTISDKQLWSQDVAQLRKFMHTNKLHWKETCTISAKAYPKIQEEMNQKMEFEESSIFSMSAFISEYYKLQEEVNHSLDLFEDLDNAPPSTTAIAAAPSNNVVSNSQDVGTDSLPRVTTHVSFIPPAAAVAPLQQQQQPQDPRRPSPWFHEHKRRKVELSQLNNTTNSSALPPSIPTTRHSIGEDYYPPGFVSSWDLLEIQ